MTVHAIVQMTISNPDSLARYREVAGEALARHGGKVESAAPSPRVLEGTLPAPDLVAILSFPSKDSALAWIGDPDLAEVHALRNNAGKSSVILVG